MTVSRAAGTCQGNDTHLPTVRPAKQTAAETSAALCPFGVLRSFSGVTGMGNVQLYYYVRKAHPGDSLHLIMH